MNRILVMSQIHTIKDFARLDIEVRHLRLIAAISDEGSITKAGKRLFLTQSALSHQLRDIEDRVGTALFLRRNRQLVLTPAGKKFLEASREVMGRMHVLQDDLASLAGSGQGLVRISTECYTCYHWLPEVLKRFAKAYPKVDIEIDVAATYRPLDALAEGKIDVAIAYSPLKTRHLLARRLFEDEMVAVMSPAHPLAGKLYLDAEDFAPQTLIVYSCPKAEQLFFREVLIPANVEPAKVLSVQLTEAIVELAKAEIGIGILARWVAQPYITSGHLHAVRITRSGLVRQWATVQRREKLTPHYLEQFVSLIHHAPLKPAALLGAASVTPGGPGPVSYTRGRDVAAKTGVSSGKRISTSSGKTSA